MSLLSKENWLIEQPLDENNRDTISPALHYKRHCHSEKTPFCQVDIYETTDFGYVLMIDGCFMLSSREHFLYHEPMVHPALFTHTNPQTIAIIGGGDCGCLSEVLKHKSVTDVTQIEIDRRITELSLEYFPELCKNNNDTRANLLFDDGIAWMKNRAPASLDVIIVDSTDPVGPAAGLFSTAFYQDCFNALKSGGILVQQSESPLIHMPLLKSMRGAMQQADFSTLQTLSFPYPCYPSGWWSCTLAGKGCDLQAVRSDDIVNKNFATEYYNLEIHQALKALPPFVLKALRS